MADNKSHQTNTDEYNDRLTQLENRRKEAWDSGDRILYEESIRKIGELKRVGRE